MSYYYRICNFDLISDRELPELAPVNHSSSANIRINRVGKSYINYNNILPYHAWESPGEAPWVNFYHVDNTFIAEYPGICRFELYPEQQLINYSYADEYQLESFSHLLLDNILPLYFSAQAKLVLHASAVAGPNGLIVFIGKSGTGKSTLAYQLSQYFNFVSDDFILIESVEPKVMALGTYPAVRLWQEPETGPNFKILPKNNIISDKLRLQLVCNNFYSEDQAQPVQSLIFPCYTDSMPAGKFKFEPLEQISVVSLILQNLFILDPGSAQVQARVLSELGFVAKKVKSYSLLFGDIRKGCTAELIKEIENL